MLPMILRRSGGLSPDRPVNLFNELERALRSAWDEQDYNGTAAYPVDVHEDEDAVYVEAELPGFKKEEINVSLEKGILRITAERKTEQKKGQAHLSERRFTRVARGFNLPAEVEENNVDAKLTDGVLYLKFNKRPEVKPRRINVT